MMWCQISYIWVYSLKSNPRRNQHQTTTTTQKSSANYFSGGDECPDSSDVEHDSVGVDGGGEWWPERSEMVDESATWRLMERRRRMIYYHLPRLLPFTPFTIIYPVNYHLPRLLSFTPFTIIYPVYYHLPRLLPDLQILHPCILWKKSLIYIVKKWRCNLTTARPSKNLPKKAFHYYDDYGRYQLRHEVCLRERTDTFSVTLSHRLFRVMNKALMIFLI